MAKTPITWRSTTRAITSGLSEWWRFTGRSTRYEFWALYVFLCFLMFMSSFLASPSLVMAMETQNYFLFDSIMTGLGVFSILLCIALFAAMIRRIRDAGGWIYSVPLLIGVSLAGPLSYMVDITRLGFDRAQVAFPAPSFITIACAAIWVALSIYVFKYLASRSKKSDPQIESQ